MKGLVGIDYTLTLTTPYHYRRGERAYMHAVHRLSPWILCFRSKLAIKCWSLDEWVGKVHKRQGLGIYYALYSLNKAHNATFPYITDLYHVWRNIHLRRLVTPRLVHTMSASCLILNILWNPRAPIFLFIAAAREERESYHPRTFKDPPRSTNELRHGWV